MYKIAILFTGEMRGNGLGINNTIINNNITDSYYQNLLTNDFKEKCTYDIFISTDKVNIDNVYNIFDREHIKNIFELNNNSYLYNINNKLPDIDLFLESYNNNLFDNNRKYINAIHQHYKVLHAWNMLEEYSNKKYSNLGYKYYDYIIRIRLDTIINNNIMNCIHFMENNKKFQFIGEWDIFSIGRPNIMQHMCFYLIYFITFDIISDIPKESYLFSSNLINKERFDLRKNCDIKWKFAPEMKYFEHIFDYCKKHNLNIDETIKKMHICSIYDYKSGNSWITE